MKVTYPVIFTQTETNILIEVPDLKILTEANEEGKEKGTLADAIEMARDAIGLKCIDESKQITPSDIKDINVNEGAFADDGSSYISYVDVDLTEYRKKVGNKMVRRNVTLPSWLNQEAEKAGINVSKVLQDALKETLRV